MSAIGGIWCLDGRPVDDRLATRMMEAVAHRGPDGEGLWVRGPVFLGHRLFANTPEAVAEKQPVAVGGQVVTFDGRLDNREELLAAVEPRDRSCSDGELTLHAYRRWGVDVVHHLVGDFAFALWDEAQQQMLCVRDPIGIKLFHYAFDDGTFVFGSEIKQILQWPGAERELDTRQLGHLLSLRNGDPDRTFYRGIHRLPAGHYLVASRGGVVERAYWEPDLTRQLHLKSDEDYVERFRELFKEAVRARLRAIGPVGVMVSGGMDSTSIFATAQRIAQEDPSGPRAPELHSFSWVFPTLPTVDESKYIREVVGEAGPHTHYIDGDDLWSLKQPPGPVVPRDEPYLAPHEALLRETFEEARRAGARTLLTGQGGELTLVDWRHLVHLLRNLRWGTVRAALRGVQSQPRRAFYRRLVKEMLPGWMVNRTSPQQPAAPPWTHPAFLETAGVDRSNPTEAAINRRYAQRHQRVLHTTIAATGQSPWTVWADQSPAEAGVELRHPFWDVRLVKFLASIPAERFLDVRWSKMLLRRAMDGVLPPQVRWRTERTSFRGLARRGMAERGTARLRGMTNDMELHRRGVVDQRRFSDAFSRYCEGDDTYRNHLWAVFAVEEWLRQPPDPGAGPAESVGPYSLVRAAG